MKIVIATGVLVLVFACGLQAGPPLEGDYRSLDGDMLTGRFSESYAGGGQGHTGNTVHATSYDGTSLGAEWWVACPVLSAIPTLTSDERDDFGNGYVYCESFYSGGSFWLTGAGPRGAGDVSYTGSLDYYTHYTAYLYVGWAPITYTTNAQFGGTFDGYCLCLTGIANAAYVGSGAQPSDYPTFLESNCSENPGLTGEWGNVEDVTMSIYDCSSSAEASTWGSIKSLYR